MISKTRTNFIAPVIVNGKEERDINNMQWDLFVINRPITYYRITHSDIQRPDIICQKIYNNMQYFWILMKFNLIDDVWNDLVEGSVIMCPNSLDIEQFFSLATTYE